MTRLLALVLTLTLAFALAVGCGDEPAHIGPDAADPCPPGTDPFTVVSHEVRGQHVRLDLQYAGGCADHDFAVWWTGISAPSCPAGVPLELQHYAHGDTCEAAITESFWVDLSPVVDQVGFCAGAIDVSFVIGRGDSVLGFTLEEGATGTPPVSEPELSIDQSCGLIDA